MVRAATIALALILCASGAQAEMACTFQQVCRHGQACEDTDLTATLYKVQSGSSSRMVVNGVATVTMDVRFSLAAELLRATVFETQEDSMTILMVDEALTHLITYAPETGETAYSLQSALARTVQSYFGTCQGRL